MILYLFYLLLIIGATTEVVVFITEEHCDLQDFSLDGVTFCSLQIIATFWIMTVISIILPFQLPKLFGLKKKYGRLLNITLIILACLAVWLS